MKRVIIIEDEKLVLLGIESLFETNADYRIVGSYSRAIPALQAVEDHEPDIIITDIKMPGMDGLEFIRNLHERNVRAKIVVLSCLEDFAIVSKAFKLGAADYLLKHELDETELFKTLDSLSIETALGNDSTGPKKSWNEFRRFSDWIHDEEPSLPQIETPVVYLMVCKKKYSETHVPLKTGVDTFWLLRFVQGLLNDHRIGQAYLDEPEGLVLIIDGSEKQREQRKIFFHTLTQQLNQYINSPVVMLRESDITTDSVTDQWKRLEQAKGAAFYIDTTKVVGVRDDGGVAKQSGGLPAHILPEPIWLLQNEQLELWQKGMWTYLEASKAAHTDPSKLCMELIVHWHQVQQLLRTVHMDTSDNIQERSTLFEYVKDFDDFSHLCQWFMQELPERTRHVHALQGHSRKIMKAKIHVLEHYDQRITLQDMANMLNMNSNYLCELFRRESGMGFIDYLNSVRIQNAKKLLLESDATVEDVSVQVGYTSASHFSRLFKKITGQTVSEFRSNHPCNPNMWQKN